MGTVVSSSTVRLADGAGLYSVLYPAASDGAGAARTPVTVVLLHGWTLDNRLWRQQIADLPARLGAIVDMPVQLLTFDLRGHGRSSATSGTDATLEQLGDDLAEVLDALVPTGPVVLVGHSLGGMAIMEYAQRHAKSFAARTVGVVLVSTSAEGSSRTSYGLSPRLARVMRILEIQGACLLARSGAWRPHRRLMPLLAPGVRWLVFGHRVDTSWVALTASMVGNAPLCAIGGFRPSVDLHHRVDTLGAMSGLPVAVLVGTLDRLTPPPCAATIAAELPDAELVTCEGAGHMLPIERPDVVTDAIAGVIRRAAKSAGVDSAGALSTGTRPTRIKTTGAASTGTRPTRVKTTGAASTGTRPTRVKTTGAASTGTRPTRVKTTGAASTGVKPTGVKSAGAASAGTVPSPTKPAETASAEAVLAPTKRDQTKRDSTKHRQGIPAPTTREPTKREPAKREPAKREPAKRGQGIPAPTTTAEAVPVSATGFQATVHQPKKSAEIPSQLKHAA